MRLLKLAVENKRWDLAAHVIVLTTARVLQNGGRPNAKDKEKGGRPKGNQNARKHGYYSKVVAEAERLDISKARSLEGIDDEIALLRAKIKSVLKKDPDNVRLIMQAVEVVARLVKTKYKLDKLQKKGLKEALNNVWNEIGFPLGFGIGTAINKI